LLVGCTTTQKGTSIGALGGAALGGIIGHQSGHGVEGAAIGAGSICVAPLLIGKWAVVAAGSVVIKNVKKFSLVAGVPARQIGWVGKYGRPLVQEDNGDYFCPETKEKYILNSEGEMNCVEA
jgi:serine acetyltransferase